jgi:GT2 family glycosyltransferase
VCREGRQKISTRTPDKNTAISVIVPTYNTANYIDEALDSVFAQTYGNFEVIVVNDGSPDTDRMEQVLEPYMNRIVYLKHGNRWLSAARNTGIRKAAGEYLAFLDSDDVWLAEHLAEQVKFLGERPSLDMVYGDAVLFGETSATGRKYSSLYPPKTSVWSFEELLSMDATEIFPSSVVVKRQAVIEAGLFDETVRYCEDIDLWLRMAYRGARIQYNPNALICRRAHATAMSKTPEKLLRGNFEVFLKLAKNLELSPHRRSLLERRIAGWRAGVDLWEGRQSLAEGNFEEARQSLARANAVFHRWKLSLVLLGVRHAPRLTRWMLRIWQPIDTLTDGRLRRLKRYQALKSQKANASEATSRGYQSWP